MVKLLYPSIIAIASFGGLLSCKSTPSAGDTEINHSSRLAVDTFSLPVASITSGDKQHWFGYYDKFQTDPSGRYVLAMEVDTFQRSPIETDTIRIGLIDLADHNKWTQIGTSTAWGWQQGCMLKWIPGSNDEVIWNDREGDTFVSRIYNVSTRSTRTLPKAIYTLSSDGTL